jgi:hypothetical protein
MLSAMLRGWLVAGVTTVTAGCEATYLIMNCAQLWASNSCAQSGSGRSPIRFQSRVRPNGMYTITPIPRSCASGRMCSSTSRLSTA